MVGEQAQLGNEGNGRIANRRMPECVRIVSMDLGKKMPGLDYVSYKKALSPMNQRTLGLVTPSEAMALDEEEEEGQQGKSVFSKLGTQVPGEIHALFARSLTIFQESKRSRYRRREREPADVLRTSRRYLEALQETSEVLGERLQGDRFASVEGECNPELVQVLHIFAAVWELVEIVFLQYESLRLITPAQLQYLVRNWLRQYYLRDKVHQLESLRRKWIQDSQPEKDPEFWEVLYGLALAGKGAQAWELLSLHSSQQATALQSGEARLSTTFQYTLDRMRELLCSIPSERKNPNGEVSLQEWQNWNKQCQQTLMNDEGVQTDGQIRTLLQILCADPTVLERQSNDCFELAMAHLALGEPQRSAQGVSYVIGASFQQKSHQLSEFEFIVFMIMDGDIKRTLQHIDTLGFRWLTAHLADILIQTPNLLLPEKDDKIQCSLQEYFLLNYAIEISMQEGLWQVAIQYLDYCPRFGIPASLQVIQHQSVGSDRKAQKLMQACKVREFYDMMNYIATLRGDEYLQEEMYGAALQWYILANRKAKINSVCDKLTELCIEGDAVAVLSSSVDFLQSAQKTICTQKLYSLVKYYELLLIFEDCNIIAMKLKKEQSAPSDRAEKQDLISKIEEKLRSIQKEAALRLSDLIQLIAVTGRLKPLLLQHLADMLSIKPSLFSSSDIYGIMQVLRNKEASFGKKLYTADEKGLYLKLRLLLTTSLADAITMESPTNDVLSMED